MQCINVRQYLVTLSSDGEDDRDYVIVASDDMEAENTAVRLAKARPGNWHVSNIDEV